MSETTIQAAPASVVTPPGVTAEAAPKRGKNPVVAVLETVGSLKITVTLFVLSLVLVFFGTLAQIDGGIWNVMDKYFRSYFVWIPVQLLVQFGQVFFNVSKTFRVSDSFVIPFPGGFSIAFALLLNLFAAYSLRIPTYLKRWKNYALMIGVCAAICLAGYVAVTNLSQWGFLTATGCILAIAGAVLVPFRKMIFFPGNRIGIITVHVGLVVMIVGELVTAWGAVEGNMVIEEGETTNVVMHNRYYELAFVDTSDPKNEVVTVIPSRFLKPGKGVDNDKLPCLVRVRTWMVNSDLSDVEKGDTRENLATTGAGLKHLAVEHKETSGTATKQTVDTPSAYVVLTDRETGKELGTFLFSVLLKDQTIAMGGKDYDVSLRFKHSYKPYSLRLEQFSFKRYEGTNTPKDFASRVTLIDEARGDDRELTIRMNEPLRHRGDTFFQADWNKKTEKGTVLQVVRNPGWQLPYWSCAIVSLGMLMHFGLNLVNFLERRAA